jgi:small subunit ribosomal protein S24e
MELSVKDKKENALLKRTEVRFTVGFDGATPGRKEVKEKLCAALKANPALTVIDVLKQGYGSKELEGYAKVYSDADAMSAEQPHALLRETGEKKEKAAKK